MSINGLNTNPHKGLLTVPTQNWSKVPTKGLHIINMLTTTRWLCKILSVYYNKCTHKAHTTPNVPTKYIQPQVYP